jgi:thiol-disulfide isomerase/thioredoxin
MSPELTNRHPSILTFALGWFAVGLLSLSIGCTKPTPADQQTPTETTLGSTDEETNDDQTNDGETKQPLQDPQAKQAIAETDPFAIADDATSKELLEFIEKTMNTNPEGETREEKIENYLKGMRAVGDAASRVLADQEVKDEAASLISLKLRTLQAFEQLANEDTAAEKTKLIELYKDDQREGISQIIASLKFSLRMDEVFQDDVDPKLAAAALIKAIDEDDSTNPMLSKSFAQYAQVLEYRDAYPEAVAVYEKLKERMAQSDDEAVRESADQFDGIIRRLGLFGKKVDLQGEYLDGSKVDWEKYRGKYVLVDFWATWCGPCIQEIPNVIANYEKYHDKGFDVLAISLDGSRSPEPEAIEANKQSVAAFIENNKLPWRTMYSSDPDATGWKHPMATNLGIAGIPFAMLVDPEGKVISFNARGEALGELLEKNLGKVDEKEPVEQDEKDTDELDEKDLGEQDEKDTASPKADSAEPAKTETDAKS